MNLSPKHLIKLLEASGFIYKRSKGSHQIYYNPQSGKTAVIPVHGNKDPKKGNFSCHLKTGRSRKR